MNARIGLFAIASAALLFASCGGGATSQGGGASDSLRVAEACGANSLQWQESDLAAIAFIGFYNDTEKAIARASQVYGVHARWVELEGDVCYLVIPRSPEANIEVSEYSYDIITNTEKVGNNLYSASGGPILVRCNSMDTEANSRITISHNGQKALVQPKLEMMDGTISMPAVTPAGEGTVRDITRYSQPLGEPNEQESIYPDPLGIANHRALMKNGRVMLKQAFAQEWAKVNGLEGICRKVFFGNWGNNVNPLVCILMDDGGIEILDYNTALGAYSYTTSGRLPGFSHIVDFKQVEGDVVAVDASGKEQVIPIYSGPSGKFSCPEESQGTRVTQFVTLTPDWKLDFGCSVGGSQEYAERFLGQFWGQALLAEGETGTYTFVVREKMVPDPASDFGSSYQPTNEKGTFTLRVVNGGGEDAQCEIANTEGELKFSIYRKALFQKVKEEN